MSRILTLGCLTLDASPVETIDAAADAGFTSVGIRLSGRRRGDPCPPLLGNNSALRALRVHAADRGIRISNVTAYHFHPEVGNDDLEHMISGCVAVGAPVLVTICYDTEAATIAKLRRFAELASYSGVRLAVEFSRYSALSSLGQAARVIKSVGSPAVGVLIDAMHFFRSGGTPNQLLQIDSRQIVLAQLCDGKYCRETLTDDQLRDEARSNRLFPGDGHFPLREFLAALPSGLEIEYEVPRQGLDALSLCERARLAYSVFHTYLGELPVRTHDGAAGGGESVDVR